MIIVAGLPSSGNRLVMEVIRRGVESASTGEVVQIWHGERAAPTLVDLREGERIMVVIPVRSERCRKLSIEEKLKQHGGSFPTSPEDMRKGVLRFVLDRDCPLYVLSYEGLVEDPVGVLTDLYEWLGLPPQPPPEGTEGELKERHAIFNANERHLK